MFFIFERWYNNYKSFFTVQYLKYTLIFFVLLQDFAEGNMTLDTSSGSGLSFEQV
jgi:hypothetical protein